MVNSKTQAIIDEPDRFFQYFSDEDLHYIFSGTTQPDRVMRLKQKFEAFFMGEDDPRANHFVDDDLTGDEDYDKAIMRLYNTAKMRDFRDTHYPDIHQRKREKEVGEIIRKPKPAPTVKEQEKKIISLVKGYTNTKTGKWVKPYQRTVFQPWSKRELRWLTNRLGVKSSKELTTQINAKFGTTRTISSVGTKKLRLRKIEVK